MENFQAQTFNKQSKSFFMKLSLTMKIPTKVREMTIVNLMMN